MIRLGTGDGQQAGAAGIRRIIPLLSSLPAIYPGGMMFRRATEDHGCNHPSSRPALSIGRSPG